MSLCNTCQQLFRGSHPFRGFLDKGITHHHNLEGLAHSVLERCSICTVLWSGISDNPPTLPIGQSVPPRLLPLVIVHGEMDHGIPSVLRFEVCYRHQARVGSQRVNRNCFDLQKIIEYSSFDRPTNSSLFVAKNWLNQCLNTHEKCKGTIASKNFLPSRLVRIGKPSLDNIMLIQGPIPIENIVGGLKYATLSHCWGTGKFLVLTAGNKKRLEEGIRISELSNTFQDAIFAARLLGIEYIWIDSLCIEQDSIVDWQSEAPLMSDVYGGATLNIAAAGSTSRLGEASVQHSKDEPCSVQTSWDDHANGLYHVYHREYWTHEMRDSPLKKRAWILQELLMAPRILYLAKGQLFWECYDLHACETCPQGLSPNMTLAERTRESMRNAIFIHQGSFPSIGSVPQPTRRSSDFGEVLSDSGQQLVYSSPSKIDPARLSLMDLWYTILELYTACDLTKPGDKLVALSGIAKVMERAMDDKYLAGLWKSCLASELFWEPAGKVHHAATYRAPSWSWASVDGRIKPAKYGYGNKLISILCCEIRPLTSDHTSAITQGLLRLSGPLFTAEFLSGRPRGLELGLPGCWGPASARFDYGPPTRYLHCLPLRGNHRSINCLLLAPTGGTKGQFKRVGTAKLQLQQLGIKTTSDFGKIKNQSWLEYEEFDGDMTYTISII